MASPQQALVRQGAADALVAKLLYAEASSFRSHVIHHAETDSRSEQVMKLISISHSAPLDFLVKEGERLLYNVVAEHAHARAVSCKAGEGRSSTGLLSSIARI